MLRRLSNIFLLLSVFITLGHNVVAHHHELENLHHGHNHHHDEQDPDSRHNIFSFAQLDETYLHSNSQTQLNFDSHPLAILNSGFIFDIKLFSETQLLNTSNVFSPPQNISPHILSLRGPPLS